MTEVKRMPGDWLVDEYRNWHVVFSVVPRESLAEALAEMEQIDLEREAEDEAEDLAALAKADAS
jgi:hypothetical protein